MQERFFDNHAVEQRQARVAGSFDLSDREAELLGLDRMGIVVMAVYVGGANVKILPNGDVRRVDQLSVSEAQVLSGERYEQVREWLMEDTDQLDLFRREPEPERLELETGGSTAPPTIVDDDQEEASVFSPVRPTLRSSRDETLARFLEEARSD